MSNQRSPPRSRRKKNHRREGSQAEPAARDAGQTDVATNGCDMHETWNAGFEAPAMAAVKIGERTWLQVSKKKEPGQLIRYIAKRS